MAEATTHIANVLCSGATTQTLTFSSIPSDYDDLVIIGQGLNNSTAGAMLYLDINFNDDTASNYWWGTNVTTGAQWGGSYIENGLAGVLRLTALGGTSNSDDTPASLYMYIPRYKQSMYNTMWFHAAAPRNTTNWSQAQCVFMGTGFWAGGAAISEIDLKTLFGYFAVGSSYDLYGISNS